MSEGEERGKRRETEEGERKSRGRREKRERDGGKSTGHRVAAHRAGRNWKRGGRQGGGDR